MALSCSCIDLGPQELHTSQLAAVQPILQPILVVAMASAAAAQCLAGLRRERSDAELQLPWPCESTSLASQQQLVHGLMHS